MKKMIVSAACLAACSLAVAKLPPLDDAGKAKAAEAAAKAAWAGKVDAYLLCKAQDRVAAYYRKTAVNLAAGAAARDAKAAAAPASAAAKPAAPAASAAVASASAATAGTATTVAGPATPTPCADPGPFAYTPPEQKPLEAAGAHSPAGNANSPPNTKTPAAAMVPASGVTPPTAPAAKAPAATTAPAKKS